ncbi:melatonin receptor type 1B-like [Montipora capricornis]|uniref:melatonin receptor type 1B-like n=1 Tax=Montipora capricornis TaxID=246305 RepID=UPI0035F1B69E
MMRNLAVSNSTNSTFPTAVTDSSLSAPPGITTYTQVTYAVIATVAFLGNMLVISIFWHDRNLLKKSYNILILSLAIGDVMTAISLATNPAFLLGDAFPYPENHILGKIFCLVIWSRAFLFQLVIFSAYICLALATERWYAVIKPMKYQSTFNKKRTLLYIASSWVWSLALVLSSFFQVGYVESNPRNRRCRWLFNWASKSTQEIVAVIQVLLKMAFPSLAMLVLYAHMLYKTRRSTVRSVESRAKMRGKMTRMIAAACLMLIVCLAPNQINFALAITGHSRLDTKLHHGLSLLVFISSCVNPLIYGLSNKNYRHGFRRLLFSVCNNAVGNTDQILSRSNVPAESNTVEEVDLPEIGEPKNDRVELRRIIVGRAPTSNN